MAHQQLDNTIALLDRLIAYPTVSSDSNLEMIEFAAGLLDDAGAHVSISTDATGGKANLFATIGPQTDGGIILSGHADVVPVDGQDWSTDPFRMDRRKGRLYGRGACDMKGFIAAVLAMLPEFATRLLGRPIHICLTYDEEVGCLGAQALVRELRQLPFRPAICMIGEPTTMRVIEGHKGCYEYATRFTGLAGHGSAPDAGVSAVEFAVRYVNRLLELREDLKQMTPPGSRFDPPWSTLQVGRIDGGIARNVIADKCSVEWEMRPVQHADADYVRRLIGIFAEDELLPAMRAVHPDADIVTEVIAEVAGLTAEAESEAVKLARDLTGANATDCVCFGTEAGLFQQLGMSCVVCGPGSIEQAHKPDEFVTIEQLDECLNVLERLHCRLAR